jgi:hypothetical protein
MEIFLGLWTGEGFIAICFCNGRIMMLKVWRCFLAYRGVEDGPHSADFKSLSL